MIESESSRFIKEAQDAVNQSSKAVKGLGVTAASATKGRLKETFTEVGLGNLTEQAKKKLPDSHLITPFQRKLMRGSKVAAGAAAMFIAGTTMMDIATGHARKKEADAMVKQQEKNEEEERKRNRKARKRQHRRTSSQRDTVQEFVFDAFENRTGHHNMGNARFRKW